MADNKKKRKRGFAAPLIPIQSGDAPLENFSLDLSALQAEDAEEQAETSPVEEPLTPEKIAATKAWRFEKSEAEILSILKRGKFGMYKVIPWGSNYTFLAALRDEENDDAEYLVVYKPVSGEAPLWDFPGGTLYKREYAAYLVSRALEWNFIPPVILRDGPHGIGTVQLFVDADEQADFYSFRNSHTHELKRVAIFDAITNNADRKAAHCLLGLNNYIWGIDHGLCFNTVPKMRTIIWDFSGQSLPDDIHQDLIEFTTDPTRLDCLRQQLSELLDRREVDVFFRRLELMVQSPRFPTLISRRQIPWGLF